MATLNRNVAELGEGLPTLRATVQYGRTVAGVDAYLYDTVARANTNLAFEAAEVDIRDARPGIDRLDLHDNGFALLPHQSAFAHAAAGEDAVGPQAERLRDNYQREMEPVIAQMSRARDVFAQPSGFLIRHGKRSAIKTMARPASFAHCDYTPGTAEEMASLILALHGRKLSHYSNFAIYQTWRAVSPPPQDSLLTLCDGRSVLDQDCLLVKNVNGPEETPGNVFILKLGLVRPEHRWYYFSALQADEVILFMAHDSRVEQQLNVLHTSFANPLAGEDAVPRASIEARFFAFFD